MASIPIATELPSWAMTPWISAPPPVGMTWAMPKFTSVTISSNSEWMPGATSNEVSSKVCTIGCCSNMVLMPDEVSDSAS